MYLLPFTEPVPHTNAQAIVDEFKLMLEKSQQLFAGLRCDLDFFFFSNFLGRFFVPFGVLLPR